MVKNISTKKVEKININEVVARAQGRFSKKDAKKGASIKRGDQIVLSSNPDDYIHSEQINKFWKPLTGLLGLAFGRIMQIAGKPDSGKSTAAMLAMKAAQDQGVTVVLWDAEGKFDSARFKERIGGLPEELVVAPSRSIVEGTQQVLALVKAIKEISPSQKILIVWDSVGASINSSEDEENDDFSKQPGVTAREVSWAIRRLNQVMERYKEGDDYSISILCINQVYANIGSVGFKQKGGAELEYLSSLILEMTRKQTLTRTRNKQKIKYGITTVARVKKNHLFGGEDCIAELDLVVSSSGIDLADEAKKKNADIQEDDDE